MEPSVCKTCGTPLSSRYEAFCLLRTAYLAKSRKDIDITKTQLHTDINDNLTSLFDAFLVPKYCCQQVFVATKLARDLKL